MDTGPEAVSRLFEARLRAGDVDGLEDLYEPGAVFADYDGAVTGWPAIRAAHRGFLDRGHELTLNEHVVFEAGDLALVHWSWTVRTTEGSTIDGASAEVLRRQPDGSWRFVIDNSDGAALIGEV